MVTAQYIITARAGFCFVFFAWDSVTISSKPSVWAERGRVKWCQRIPSQQWWCNDSFEVWEAGWLTFFGTELFSKDLHWFPVPYNETGLGEHNRKWHVIGGDLDFTWEEPQESKHTIKMFPNKRLKWENSDFLFLGEERGSGVAFFEMRLNSRAESSHFWKRFRKNKSVPVWSIMISWQKP